MGEAKRRREHEPSELRYWIALNGPSCAINTVPMREPVVSPTPEQLIGYPTLEEAQAAQRLCLTAPIEEVRAYFERRLPDVQSGRQRVIQSPHPEPAVQGELLSWMECDPARRADAWPLPADAHAVTFGPALVASFEAIGAPVPNADLDAIVHRHLAARATAPAGRTLCTHTRGLLRSGRPFEIITATRRGPNPGDGLLTICCLTEEWEALTHEARHRCSGREN